MSTQQPLPWIFLHPTGSAGLANSRLQAIVRAAADTQDPIARCQTLLNGVGTTQPGWERVDPGLFKTWLTARDWLTAPSPLAHLLCALCAALHESLSSEGAQPANTDYHIVIDVLAGVANLLQEPDTRLCQRHSLRADVDPAKVYAVQRALLTWVDVVTAPRSAEIFARTCGLVIWVVLRDHPNAKVPARGPLHRFSRCGADETLKLLESSIALRQMRRTGGAHSTWSDLDATWQSKHARQAANITGARTSLYADDATGVAGALDRGFERATERLAVSRRYHDAATDGRSAEVAMALREGALSSDVTQQAMTDLVRPTAPDASCAHSTDRR